MSSNRVHVVATSAPGKVLLAGGYLILGQHDSGLVLAVDARVFAVVSRVNLPGLAISEDSAVIIHVNSPQFKDCKSVYVAIEREGRIHVARDESTRSNPFIQKALFFVLNYICAYKKQSLQRMIIKIDILTDAKFYSTEHEGDWYETAPPFQDFKMTLDQIRKTGLGSSAAMTTAVVSALFQNLLPETCLYDDIERIHNLAQLSHSFGQGCVGSGFDVAAACFGSCIYQRFSPSLIKNVPCDSNDFKKLLIEQIHQKWDNCIDEFCLATRLQLLLIDIEGGASTPKMSSAFLNWIQTNVLQGLTYLNEIRVACKTINEQLDFIKNIPFDDPTWIPTFRLARKGTYIHFLRQTRIAFESLLNTLRRLSKASNVDIVPQKIEPLIRALDEVPGVVGVGVPGAGGMDALFCLILRDEQIAEKVNAAAHSFHDSQSSKLMAKVIPVEQCLEGLRFENEATIRNHYPYFLPKLSH